MKISKNTSCATQYILWGMKKSKMLMTRKNLLLLACFLTQTAPVWAMDPPQNDIDARRGPQNVRNRDYVPAIEEEANSKPGHYEEAFPVERALSPSSEERAQHIQQRQEIKGDTKDERGVGDAGHNQTAVSLPARSSSPPPQIPVTNHQEKKTENWKGKKLNYDRLDDRLCHYTSGSSIACLNLSVNDLDSRSISLLRKFSNLEVLNLEHNNKIDDEAINYLTYFPYLSELILDNTNITSQAIIELFRKAPNLTKLSLINIDNLDSAAINSLAHLTKLKSLTLDSSSLTDDTIKAIGSWPHGQLQALSLKNTNKKFFPSRITCKGAEYLFAAPGLNNLIELNLSNQNICNKGIKILMRKNLKILNLSNNGIGDNGLESILHPFPNPAISLDLSHNSLTDEGMETVLFYMFEKREDGLRRFPYFRILNLSGNKGIKNKEYLTKVFEEEYRKHNGFLLIMHEPQPQS